MNQDLTEVIAIIDESGSMAHLVQETISGFNTFLTEQKKLPGEMNITLCLFNHNYRVVSNGLDVKKFEGLDDKLYRPDGYTALYDAIGATVDSVGYRLSKTEECDRPAKVIVVIITDGHENFSKEFNKEQIKTLIDEQTNKYNWEFVYLGANQNAFDVGTSMGIRNNANYSVSATMDLYTNTINTAVASVRSGGTINIDNSVS